MADPSPVFVDPTGRRHRRAALVGWALAGLIALYLVLLLISLVAPPGSIRLTLPGIGPVIAPAGPPSIGRPGQAPRAVLSPTPLPTPRPSQTGPGGGQGPGSSGSASPGPSQAGGNIPTASPTAKASGQPTPVSTNAATPQPTKARSPSVRPTPRASGRP